MSGDDCFWVATVAALVAWGVYLWRFADALLAGNAPPNPAGGSSLPQLTFEDDDAVDPTRVVRPTAKTSSAPTTKILCDDGAAGAERVDDPPRLSVVAVGKTDTGLVRKQNQDELLLMPSHGLFVVADGVGGERGGALASKLAVMTIERAFEKLTFEGPVIEGIPERASDLVRAIRSANEEVFLRAAKNDGFEGMATTICAARFIADAQRLYVGHVGDSRLYRYRGGVLRKLTTDHTVTDTKTEEAGRLERALGLGAAVPVDALLATLSAGDVYLLCTDGLTKTVRDAEIQAALETEDSAAAVDALIAAAKEKGGKDNVTVVVVRIAAVRK